jgi:hypothetical protein
VAQYLILEQKAVLTIVEAGGAADNAFAVPVENVVEAACPVEAQPSAFVVGVVVGPVVIDEDVEVVVLASASRLSSVPLRAPQPNG